MKALAQLKMGVVICCLLAVAGCAQNNAAAPAGKASFAVSGVVVLPVKLAADLGENLPPADEIILEDGSRVLDGLLKEVLAGKANVRFTSTAPPERTGGPARNLAAVRDLAIRQGGNAVLEVTLSRYNERIGGEYGAKQPAAVTFAYRLYEVGEGRVLCHGGLDERQQSLTENLLTLPKAQSRGLVWLTAEELARDGLKEKLGQCPYLEKK